MTIAAYQQMRAPTSRWRRRARVAILEVLHRVTASTPTAEVISLVDAAYPFGEREMHPYKMWLAERRTLIDALGAAPDRTLPDRNDADVCMVASDAVEEGRIDFAVSLMDEQAPNRLNRKCPACGAAVGQPCRDAIEQLDLVSEDGTEAEPLRRTMLRRTLTERIVPHVSRLVVDDGPLFGARP